LIARERETCEMIVPDETPGLIRAARCARAQRAGRNASSMERIMRRMVMLSAGLRAGALARAAGLGPRILLCILLSAPAQAHHSFAMFDRGEGKEKSISGVVTELSLVNPHSWLKILVAGPDGRAIHWSFEMGSPNTLLRMGWTKDSVSPGDKITVIYYPLRAGSYGGELISVALPSGKSLKGLMEGDRGFPTPATE
jgi:hypothetical protein